MITISSNRAKWIQRANDTASVFRRRDVQSIIARDLAKNVRKMNKQQILGGGIGASGPFKPLAASTIKAKGHKRFLINKGKLFRQATRGGSI